MNFAASSATIANSEVGLQPSHGTLQTPYYDHDGVACMLIRMGSHHCLIIGPLEMAVHHTVHLTHHVCRDLLQITHVNSKTRLKRVSIHTFSELNMNCSIQIDPLIAVFCSH